MISGDVVDLKPFELEDLEFLLRWNNDPEYVGEFEPFEAVTEEELREWLPKTEAGRSWYIIQTRDGAKVGQLVVTAKSRKSVQVGYRGAPAYRNKGYCTEAVKTAVRHVFADTGAEVVVAEANLRNTASWRVLERAGFKRKGFKERALYLNGRWLDGYIYELNKRDYSRP